MLSVTQLAKKLGISRATVLYYEKKGILTPSTRSENGYRWYDDTKLELMKTVIAYRGYGLPVAQLKELIGREDNVAHDQILRTHFDTLEREISDLRKQQRAIVQLLNQPLLLENSMVTKDRWVEIMRAAGLSENDMFNWHRKFEAMEPEEHQKFLESLGIEQEEIAQIRKL